MNERYEAPDKYSFLPIPVLQFLTGAKWDQAAKNFLMALRPSRVRECWDETDGSFQSWRVTVWLEGDKEAPRIRKIVQDVQVGLDEGFEDGSELRAYMIERGLSDLGVDP